MKRYYIVFALILALLVSCKKDTNPPIFNLPDMNQESYALLSYHDVTIADTMTLENTDIVVKLYYSTDSLVGTSECKDERKEVTSQIVSSEGLSVLISQISGLQENTTYYYFYGFISQYNEKHHNGIVAQLSSVRSFTTLKNQPPDVRTKGSSDVGFYTATISAEKVSDNSDSQTTEWGVCYSTNSNPGLTDTKIICSSNDNGSANFSLSSLVPGTTYYYRAYGKNKYGTSYGEEKSFTTISTNVMLVETDSSVTLGSNFAILSCKLKCDEGVVVSERGFCYSTTNQTPTTEKDSKVDVGGGASSFQGYITGLSASTRYYARAYAVCQYGKIYGNVITFTTEK